LPGGKAESIISDYDEGAEEDTVTPAEPRLASVNSVMITGGIGVLSSDDEIEKLGKDWKKPKDQGLLINEEDGLTDGSEWWIYPKHGLAVKERSWLKKDDHLTERIRLLTVQAGEISGIRVGSSVSELRERLGAPQVVNAQPLPSDRFATDMMQAVTTSSKEDKKKEKSKKDKNNSPETLVPETAVVQNVDAVPSGIPNSPQIDSYLDDGLRFCHDGVKVLWIDVARPTELLKTGTTSFVQPNRTRVYVESFTGYNGAVQLNMHNEASFKNYLRRLPSIELVNSRDDADLVIKARVTNFTQDKDQLFGSLIPYDYSCQTTLEYDLIDVATGKYIARDEKITGESKASFRKDIYIAITGGIVFSKLLGGDTGTPVVFLVAAGTIYHLKRQMQKAANRCPGISERQVFDRLTQDVNNAVDYKAQITAIDYAKGWLTLNVGSEDGISASATQRPFEFEVALGDAPLLDKSEDGRKADYYSAVVREVSAHSCVCELRHVEGGVKSSGYEIPSTPAPEIVKQLPDPTTGVLTARAWTRFAPVTVISDADIRRSDEYEEQKRKEREAQQKAAEEQARQNKK
jgi:hypothetical protein